jgi:hypothetical protein
MSEYVSSPKTFAADSLAKTSEHDSAPKSGLRVKWWEWLAFATVLELFLPRRRTKAQWWDLLVLAVVIVGAWPQDLTGDDERKATPLNSKSNDFNRAARKSVREAA